MQAIFALKLIISASAWLLDDAIIAILKVDLMQFRFRLISSSVAALIGLGVMLCRS
ncbi:hypothetical protein QUA82_02920 [Microcoleus sp. F8-D3]